MPHLTMHFSRLIAPSVALGALFLAACDSTWHTDYGYAGGDYGGSYASLGWSNARYDALGYPIYGYDDGRPVYGYTASGLPIFSFGALTSYCYVPNWGPAPWYCGHWHYPRHIYRRPLPPRYPHHHHPGLRPPASHPHNFPPGNRPHHRPDDKPGSMHRPARPNTTEGGHHHAAPPGTRPGQKPHGKPEHNRPHTGNTYPPGNRPPTGARPAGHGPPLPPNAARPLPGTDGNRYPQAGGSANVTRPVRPSRPGHASDRPSSRPSFPRPSGTNGAPSFDRPSLPPARPSTPSFAPPRASAVRPASPSFSSPRPSSNHSPILRPSANRPSGPGTPYRRPGGPGKAHGLPGRR